MLSRSFKPAKCKTALKLAVSRMKLLKNRREGQQKQLKMELAKLLESGQDQTARIRVEHFVREEKTFAAYELIEIYCELIAAHLPIIESQKNCPIDLKEAISCVIFASPRCVDIPELLDVRKHFTAEYGKKFISAAIELRTECGVHRLLVKKLSAKAPDGPTKIKILKAIAEEHNVRWEPKPFGENDAKSFDDLQIAPNTDEKASYKKLSHINAPPVHGEKGHPNLHAYSQRKEMDEVPTTTNFYEHNASFAAKKAGGSGDRSTTSSRSNPEIKSSGTGSQEMDFGDSYSGNKCASPKGKQNWNVEFKDATSAAQGAAESAELASMAARVAAELSNPEKMIRQYSIESHNSFGIGLRDEVPQEFSSRDDNNPFIERVTVASRAATKFSIHRNNNWQFSAGSQSSSTSGLSDEVPREYAFHDDGHFSANSNNRSFCSSIYGIYNKQLNARKQYDPVGEHDQNYRNSHENKVKHDQSTSLPSTSAFGDDIDNPFSYGSQMANIYPHFNSIERENNEYFDDARKSRQSSKASLYSEFVFPSDDHNDIMERRSQKMGSNVGADPCVIAEGDTQRRNLKETSHNKTAAIFDDSGPEDRGFKFPVDDEYERQGSVTFDDSDNPSSESEEDLIKPKVAASYVDEYLVPIRSTKHRSIGSSSMNDETGGSNRKSRLSPSSTCSDRKIDITKVSENIFACEDLPKNQPCSKVLSFKDALLPELNPGSNRSSHEEAKTKAQHSSSLPKTVRPNRSESSNLGGNTASKEKASHVHPKLPDYESVAAHFLSLQNCFQ